MSGESVVSAMVCMDSQSGWSSADAMADSGVTTISRMRTMALMCRMTSSSVPALQSSTQAVFNRVATLIEQQRLSL